MIPTNPWFLRIFLESMNLRLSGEGLCSSALSTCPCGLFLYELHEGYQEIWIEKEVLNERAVKKCVAVPSSKERGPQWLHVTSVLDLERPVILLSDDSHRETFSLLSWDENGSESIWGSTNCQCVRDKRLLVRGFAGSQMVGVATWVLTRNQSSLDHCWPNGSSLKKKMAKW